MLDRAATQLLQPALTCLARACVRRGIAADALTLAGFAVGMAAATLIAFEQYIGGLLLILLSRLLDGLDGTVARLTIPTDRGGFLDIALDFVFYASIPLAFAVAQPATNALPAAVLLAAFIGTGTSFLAYATLAAKRGMQNLSYPGKSFYFLGGLTEATETLAVFAAMCLWPAHFSWLAFAFAAACLLTTLTRLWWGWQTLR